MSPTRWLFCSMESDTLGKCYRSIAGTGISAIPIFQTLPTFTTGILFFFVSLPSTVSTTTVADLSVLSLTSIILYEVTALFHACGFLTRLKNLALTS